MVHYETRRVCGRQYIFEERPRWLLLGLGVAVLVGMVCGLMLGLVVSVGGLFPLQLLVAGLAIFVAYDAYDLTFVKKSGTDDKVGFMFMVLICSGVLVVLGAAVWYSYELLKCTISRCLVFSAAGVAIGIVAFAYHKLVCQDDQRKHHLGPCSPDGEEPDSSGQSAGGMGDAACTNREAANRFVSWILSRQWWHEVNGWCVPAAEDCFDNDQIVVYNQTLKLVKVCIYSPHDVVCWVPVGGIAGSCVGLVRVGEKTAFTLPRAWRGYSESTTFQIKVFQPGLLDKELVYYPDARRGEFLAFTDVEGMVRRSRVLSSSQARTLKPKTSSASLTESSGDEGMRAAASLSKTTKFARPSDDCSNSSPQRIQRSGSMMHRSYSIQSTSSCSSLLHRSPRSPSNRIDHDGELSTPQKSESLCSFEEDSNGCHEKSPSSLPWSPARSSSPRKAAPDEVVVRNRSGYEIRALLYNSNDYTYLVPLIGKLTACGDVILPDAERRFNLEHSMKEEFTLKVYSVGQGARELTCFSASLGNTYCFNDSLLS